MEINDLQNNLFLMNRFNSSWPFSYVAALQAIRYKKKWVTHRQ